MYKQKDEHTTLIARTRNDKRLRLGGMPHSPETWIILADKLKAWAHKPSSKNIKDFATEHNYSFAQLERWAMNKKHEYFTEVFEAVLYIIDARRAKPLLDDKRQIKNKDYFNFVKLEKKIYDAVLRRLEKEELEQQAAATPQIITKYVFAEKEKENVTEADVVEEGK